MAQKYMIWLFFPHLGRDLASNKIGLIRIKSGQGMPSYALPASPRHGWVNSRLPLHTLYTLLTCVFDNPNAKIS